MKPSEPVFGVEPVRWLAGAIGGFVGAALFGALTGVSVPFAMEELVPAMYGFEPGVAVAWLFHQWHGVVLGLLYVLLVEKLEVVRATAASLPGAVGLGVVYGVTATALPVLVLPLWLVAVGYPDGPGFPNFTLPETAYVAAGHVVYALPVALSYYLVASTDSDDVAGEEPVPA